MVGLGGFLYPIPSMGQTLYMNGCFLWVFTQSHGWYGSMDFSPPSTYIPFPLSTWRIIPGLVSVVNNHGDRKYSGRVPKYSGRYLEDRAPGRMQVVRIGPPIYKPSLRPFGRGPTTRSLGDINNHHGYHLQHCTIVLV